MQDVGHLLTEFSKAVVHISGILMPDGFDTTADESLVDTFEKVSTILDDTGRICVWSGASDNTIYTSPEVNHAFRAWHDYRHMSLQAPFTQAGERCVCERQQRDIDLYCGYASKALRDEFKRILDIEINQQIEYKLSTGEFVSDQLQFYINHTEGDYHV